MKKGEMIDMGATTKAVWKYLTEVLGTDGEGAFVSYTKIRKAVGKKSRHSIAYAVERLRARGKVRILDGKLYVVEGYSAS